METIKTWQECLEADRSYWHHGFSEKQQHKFMQAEIDNLREELAKYQENAAANKVNHDAFNQLIAERAELLRLATQAKRHQDKLTAERDALATHNTMLKAALRGVIKVADRKTDEFDAAHAALGASK